MKKLERFILREIISDGAAGTVYKAEEVLPGDNRRVVAIKVLPPIAEGDQLGQERFFNEVKVLAQLAVQPHVVTIYAMGQTEGYPWLAMEYAETTAQNKITEEPAPPAEVLKLLEQVGRGLKAIHTLEPPLIHQDIKPANILIDAGGGGGNYKITDFSLATIVAANRTHGLATVRYAAPEMLSSEFGTVGPATDLYSLGHVAYELALGGRLHRAQFPAVFEGNSNREPPPNKWMMWHASGGTRAAAIADIRKEFPPDLSDIVARLMAKSPHLRYASAAELLSDLARANIATLPENIAVRAAPPSLPVTPSVPPPLPVPTQPPPASAATPVTPPKATAAPAPQVRYYVRLRGRVTGPFDLPTLQRQVRQGQLSRLHQVSSDQVTWRSAAEIEGLYGPTVL
ncbi:MAG: protein kinase [Phycisphaerales bacterium]|nr:protein kinase [Phycisphaerales bacterium]